MYLLYHIMLSEGIATNQIKANNLFFKVKKLNREVFLYRLLILLYF